MKIFTHRGLQRIARLLVLAQILLLAVAFGTVTSSAEGKTVIPYSDATVRIDGRLDPIWDSVEWSSKYSVTYSFNSVDSVPNGGATYSDASEDTPTVHHKAFWSMTSSGVRYLYILLEVEDSTLHTEACEADANLHPTTNGSKDSSPKVHEADRFLLAISEVELTAGGTKSIAYKTGSEANGKNVRLTDEIPRNANGLVTSGDWFQAQIIRNDENGYLAECRYTFAATSETALTYFNMNLRVTDGGMVPEYCSDDACRTAHSQESVDPVRYSWFRGEACRGLEGNLWYDRVGLIELGSTENAIITESSVAVDVSGRQIILDGTGVRAEGWAILPYTYLDCLRGAPADSEVISTLTEGQSKLFVSYNASKLYLLFESTRSNTKSLNLQLGFAGATAGAEGKGLFLSIALPTDAASTAPAMTLQYGDGAAYAAGDAFYDGTKACVARNASRTTAEIEIPFPATQIEAAMNGDTSFTLGACEQVGTQYLTTTEGWNANVGTITVVLPWNLAGLKQSVAMWIEGTKATVDYPTLQGIRLSVLGDDTLTGEGIEPEFRWTSMLASKYGWEYYEKVSAGAGIVAAKGEKVRALSDIIRSVTNNDPHVVLVTGGWIDYTENVPLGMVGDESKDTFAGAIYNMIAALRRKFTGNTCIVFVAPYSFPASVPDNPNTASDYAAVMAAVCEDCGAYCFRTDLVEVSGVNVSDAEFRVSNCISADDAIHLNLAGMQKLMPKIEAFLDGSLRDWSVHSGEILDAWADRMGYGEEEEYVTGDKTVTTEPAGPRETTPAAPGKSGGCKSAFGAAGAICLLLTASLGTTLCVRRREQK